MHFFRAREAADEWVAGREAVAALSLEDAFELARAHWVERARAAAARAAPAGASVAPSWLARVRLQEQTL